MANAELEEDLDNLAHFHGMQVIRMEDITGFKYIILNKDDAWLYLLNILEPDQTAH